MTTKRIQQEVDQWASQFKTPYWSPHEILAAMQEEQGEIAREVNHLFGPKKKKADEKPTSLSEELGDLLFRMCCMANSQNICLTEAFVIALNKAYGRDNDRFPK